MFGLFHRKEEDPRAVHVREFRRRSKMLKLGQPLDHREKRRLPAKYLTLLTWLLTGGALTAFEFTRPPSSISFTVQGLGVLNDILFPSVPPTVFDDQNLDRVFAGFAQAFVLCIVAAILPVSAYVWSLLRDKARSNAYMTFWGTTVGLPFLYFFIKDFLAPLLVDVFDVIS